MKENIVLDLTELPAHGLGTASQTWWGTLAFMLIEGTGFALSIVDLSLPDEPGAAMAVGCPAARPVRRHGADRPAAGKPCSQHPRRTLGARAGSAKGSPRIDRHDGARNSAAGPARLRVSGDAHQMGSKRIWLDRLGYARPPHHPHPDGPDRDAGPHLPDVFAAWRQRRAGYGDVSDNAMYWNFVVIDVVAHVRLPLLGTSALSKTWLQWTGLLVPPAGLGAQHPAWPDHALH